MAPLVVSGTESVRALGGLETVTLKPPRELVVCAVAIVPDGPATVTFARYEHQ
ncbi:MAG: hypothetical protein JO186_11705 [Actinobacteria bacterium]|nr:hypothetical protein [Actinomycetota bacterium]